MHDSRFMMHESRSILSYPSGKGNSRKSVLCLFLCILYLASCIFLCASSVYALEVPQLHSYVNDYAGMLSFGTRTELEKELQAFEETDSTQIVILTVPSLEGEVLEEFSIRVADSWKIGQRQKDNGVILLVAKQERKIRIEVGRGLEGRMTDLMAGRIIDLVIKPKFKRGDFDGGFVSGVHALMDGVRGEFRAEDEQQVRGIEKLWQFFSFLMFGLVILIVIGNVSRVMAGISGAVGLPLLTHQVFSIGGMVMVVMGIIGFISGVLIPSIITAGRRISGGGVWPGATPHWRSGGISGSGGFGGGFSGGGGGFGGGGASGSW